MIKIRTKFWLTVLCSAPEKKFVNLVCRTIHDAHFNGQGVLESAWTNTQKFFALVSTTDTG